MINAKPIADIKNHDPSLEGLRQPRNPIGHQSKSLLICWDSSLIGWYWGQFEMNENALTLSFPINPMYL
jgi:hypothetical protein